LITIKVELSSNNKEIMMNFNGICTCITGVDWDREDTNILCDTCLQVDKWGYDIVKGNVRRLRVAKTHPLAVLPRLMQPGDVCFDVCATEKVFIAPGQWAKIGIGCAFEVPKGHRLMVYPRSGLMSRGIVAGNGVIDTSYRKEVSVVLFNHSDYHFEVKAGDRIAQIALERVTMPLIRIVEAVEPSDREGFGSTGV
jgi:dUTP pyrophosphatase